MGFFTTVNISGRVLTIVVIDSKSNFGIYKYVFDLFDFKSILKFLTIRMRVSRLTIVAVLKLFNCFSFSFQNIKHVLSTPHFFTYTFRPVIVVIWCIVFLFRIPLSSRHWNQPVFLRDLQSTLQTQRTPDKTHEIWM